MSERYIEKATVVGNEITEARKAKGMSTKRLAKAMGINENIVMSWEKGKILPNEGQAYKLSNILQIPPQNLKEPEIKVETIPAPKAPKATIVHHISEVHTVVNHKTPRPFAEQLKEIMEKNNLSQKALADLMGVGPKTVHRYLATGSLPSSTSLSKYEKDLGTKFDAGTKTRANAPGGYHEPLERVEVSEFFAYNLKDQIAKSGKTAKEVAHEVYPDKEIGYAQQMISKFANGHLNPPKDVLEKLNNLFGVNLDSDLNASKHEEVKMEEALTDDFMKEVYGDWIVRTSRTDKVFVSNVKKRIGIDKESALCKAIGIVPGYFLREDAERTAITLDLAVKVSKYLNVPVDDLVKDTEGEKLKAEIEEYEAKIKALKEKLNKLS